MTFLNRPIRKQTFYTNSKSAASRLCDKSRHRERVDRAKIEGGALADLRRAPPHDPWNTGGSPAPRCPVKSFIAKHLSIRLTQKPNLPTSSMLQPRREGDIDDPQLSIPTMKLFKWFGQEACPGSRPWPPWGSQLQRLSISIHAVSDVCEAYSRSRYGSQRQLSEKNRKKLDWSNVLLKRNSLGRTAALWGHPAVRGIAREHAAGGESDLTVFAMAVTLRDKA